MSCGISGLDTRLMVNVITKVATPTSGHTLLPVFLFAVWASLQHTGSFDNAVFGGDSGRILRGESYTIKMRLSPVMDVKRIVTTLTFTEDNGNVIYPKSYKVKGGMAIFECTDRNES